MRTNTRGRGRGRGGNAPRNVGQLQSARWPPANCPDALPRPRYSAVPMTSMADITAIVSHTATVPDPGHSSSGPAADSDRRPTLCSTTPFPSGRSYSPYGFSARNGKRSVDRALAALWWQQPAHSWPSPLLTLYAASHSHACSAKCFRCSSPVWASSSSLTAAQNIAVAHASPITSTVFLRRIARLKVVLPAQSETKRRSFQIRCSATCWLLSELSPWRA